MHIIYHKETTKIHYGRTRTGRAAKAGWATESAAKAARTRAKLDPTLWLIAESSEFRASIEKKEIRRNLMSGKEFECSVNAGYNTCPSSETYWSS
jgi:hypothetical protein